MLRLAVRIAQALVVATAFIAASCANQAYAADAAFRDWLELLWPRAEALGISRASFDAATRGLEPDLSLPDLIIPGRPARAPADQPEFVLTPADYIKDSAIARLAAHGGALRAQHRATLAEIERRYGVPGEIVLAIFGRETDYGRHRNGHSALRALATQGFYGRRKDQFAEEFLLAVKMVHDGHVRAAAMQSSWAGAMGLTQFLPSDFFRYAVDFDGDGRRDIFNSVPDALASTANQLVGKGWRRGQRWAYEAHAPAGMDCTMAQPGVIRTIRDWLAGGFRLAHGRRLSAGELAEPASVLMPEGLHGPAFLTPKNYFVIKDYNFSDLYVLFVGHLSDRLVSTQGFETPWRKSAQLRTAQVEEMQQYLARIGLYRDKIDGKAGMLTRAALGEYQKVNGLALDCWPTQAVLDHMRAAAAR